MYKYNIFIMSNFAPKMFMFLFISEWMVRMGDARAHSFILILKKMMTTTKKKHKCFLILYFIMQIVITFHSWSIVDDISEWRHEGMVRTSQPLQSRNMTQYFSFFLLIKSVHFFFFFFYNDSQDAEFFNCVHNILQWSVDRKRVHKL